MCCATMGGVSGVLSSRLKCLTVSESCCWMVAGLLGHGHDSSASLASSCRGPMAGAGALLFLLDSFVRCFSLLV
jgi:hypothetical protein